MTTMTRPLGKSMRGVFLLAASLMLLGTTPAPPRLDAGMAERVVSGAEWLAKTAAARHVAPSDSAITQDRIEWLLSAGLATEDNHTKFSEHLAAVGYPPELAVYYFLEELPLVLMAYEAVKTQGIRERRIIQKEIHALPTLPLNDADEQRRTALIHEKNLASVPKEAKQIISQYTERMASLLSTPQKGGMP